MNENLLEYNGKTDDGLQLNDEKSIIQEEQKKTLDGNEKKNNEKHFEEITQQNGYGFNDEIKCDYNAENNEQCEQNSKKNFSNSENGIEASNYLLDENVSHDIDRKGVNGEKKEEILESRNDNFCRNEKDLELNTTLADNYKNLTSIKENNAINSTVIDPTNIQIQHKTEKNEKALAKETKNSEKQDIEEYDKETVCGIGIFKPQWMQHYATAKVYVILYSIIGILHGSYYAYLIASLSTLEKRFAFKSKVSGVIMIVDELFPLFFGVIIGYYSSKAHRPRILAISMLLSAGCCFITSFPYFIYGSTKNLMFDDVKNNTGTKYCDADIESESCDPDRPQNFLAVLFLILGSFLKGFGNLGYYAIGLAYMDDNAKKKNTPIYLAISLALRLLGPLLGFLMSSGFLKYYENPLYDPGFGPDDPRWIGAWWIGFFLQGILLVIFTIPIALFPRRLPGQKKVEKVEALPEENGMKKIFTGLISALKRLGKNPVFIVLIINTNMKVFGHFGHAIMLPKYMENQFRLSASEASLYSGAVSILCIIISTILGGFLIWKYRPQIKALLLGMIVSEIILCIGFLILMIPRCQTSEMLHFGIDEDGLILNSVCNRNCDCSTSAFTPFCGPDDKTLYFSPCYAGCTLEMNSSLSSKTNKEFGNCSCVDQLQVGATISEGFCPDENCRGQMIAYLIILFIMVTVSNLFTVAATMILLRSVHPSDKSIALGTFETFICLFGFIPFPVTFGALVDSACLVWEKSCGETGNCWFYDMDKYNYLLHGVSSLFSSFSVVCLIILYFLSHRVRNLYVEEEEELRQEESKYVDIKLDTVSGSVTKL